MRGFTKSLADSLICTWRKGGRMRGQNAEKWASETGLTLLEMIVVLAIMAIVAGLVVPNVIGRPDQARATVARTDMQAIAAALKLYRLDTGEYPTTRQGLASLVERPSGPDAPENWNPDGYLERLPVDPWNRPYAYRLNRDGRFELLSLGADGRTGGERADADLAHVAR